MEKVIPFWFMALFSSLEMCRGCRCPGWTGRCEEWPGLSRTGHSRFQSLPASSNQFQLAPTYPSPGMAQPHSQGGGASGKKYLGKGKTLCRKQVGTKKKKKKVGERPLWAARSKQKEGEEVAQAEILLQPLERPWWSRWPHHSPWRTACWSR